MMVKTKELSISSRQKIINLHKLGNSYGEISKRLDIQRSTLQSVIKKFAEFGTAETLHGRSQKKTTVWKRNCFMRSIIIHEWCWITLPRDWRLRKLVWVSAHFSVFWTTTGCMVFDLDELHFTNHVMLLLACASPNFHWIRRKAFGTKFYGN